MGFVTRRLLALAASAILLGSACGTTVSPTPVASPRQSSPSPGASAGPSPSTAPASAPPSTSGDLVVAVASDPVSFTVPGDDPTSQRVARLVFQGLYRPDAQLAMVPDLATAPPSVGGNGLTWTVHLQPDARWQDGTPVTSADVAFTYGMAESQQCRLATSVCAAVHATLNSVTTPNPTTVVFHLARPSASFLADALGTPIFPQAAVQASFARFGQALGTLDAGAVASTNQKIADAMAQTACLAGSPPASCLATSYVAQLQAILDRPGIAAPRRDVVTAYGPLTADAYGLDLVGALGDLVAALDAQGADRLAAGFRLLDFQQDPLGSGPYRIGGYQPGTQLVLDRVAGTPSGPVLPARVIFRIMPDTEVAAAALQRGEVQWVPDIPPEDMPPLESDTALQLARYPTASVTYLAFNVRRGHLFYDVNLRRAVAECIALPQAVHDATGGDGVPLRGFVSPASWAYDASLPAPTYDPAAAKRLIQASGWKLGSDGIYVKGTTRLATTLWVRQGTSPRVGFAGLAAQQLRACGFDVTVREADLLTGILPLLSYPNRFDLYLGVRQMSLDPNDDAPLFLSANIPGKSNPDDANTAGWHDALTDRLFAQAGQATDPATRADLYAQLQQRLSEYLPYLFLWADAGHAALVRGVTAGGEPLDLSSPLYDWNLDGWTLGGR